MNNNLKVILGTVAGIMIGGLTVVGANQAIQAMQNTEIKVSLNGQIQEFKDETTGEIQYPITYNNRTYLPLRNVAQLSGLDVNYEQSSNTALLKTSSLNTILHHQETSNNENLKAIWQGNNYYWIEISEDGKTVSHRCDDGEAAVISTNIGEDINIKKLLLKYDLLRDGDGKFVESNTSLVFLTTDGRVFISDSFEDLHFPNSKLNFYYLCNDVKDIDTTNNNETTVIKILKNNKFTDLEFLDSNKDFSYKGIDGTIQKIINVGNDKNTFAYRIFALTQEGYVYYADHIFSNVEDNPIQFTKFEGIEKISQITDSSIDDKDIFYSGKIPGYVCFERHIKEVRSDEGIYSHDVYRCYVISNESYDVLKINDVCSTT